MTLGPTDLGASVRATAPVRIADVGGWTDTWFAGHGAVCHLAAGPGAWAEVTVVERAAIGAPALVDAVDLGVVVRAAPGVEAVDLGVVVAVTPDVESSTGSGADLLRATLDAHLAETSIDPEVALSCRVGSAVPAGSSVGTSASVVVALLGALRAVSRASVEPETVARAAWAVEAERLGRQTGVQDQWAAACGGPAWLEIGPFPAVRWRPLVLPTGVLDDLGHRLVTVYLGQPHDSSAVHDRVIAELEHEGPGAPRLERLRLLAAEARDALENGDVDGWGGVLSAATEAQAALHPSLVGGPARAVIAAARAAGALGWKVNGAGGDGGSVTVLTGNGSSGRAAVESALAALGGSIRSLGLHPTEPGLRLT